MALYSYQNLTYQEDHIRLATIAPGNFEDDIVITLSQAAFNEDDPPSYEALSYVWGPTEDAGMVQIIDGEQNMWPYTPSGGMFPSTNAASQAKMLIISRNLHIALQHLRLTDEARTMWIDAICIDQNNDIEKGPYVGMMGRIFRKSSRVIVWLGPEANDSDRAMSLMDNLGAQLEVDWSVRALSAAEGATDVTIASAETTLPFGEEDLCSIYYLLCRPWYYRFWIRQEILLANSKAIVCCGTSSILWSNFRKALAAIGLKQFQRFSLYDELHDCRKRLEGFTFQTPNVALDDWKRTFGEATCSDPRDRIYAGLALMIGSNDLGITPDYRKTTGQVYEDAVLRFITKKKVLHILGQCQLHSSPYGPSWVPDWSVRTTSSTKSPRAYYQFASSVLYAWFQFPEEGVLRVAGVSTAIIQAVEPVHLIGTTNQAVLEALRDVITRTMAHKGLIKEGDSSITEQLARILVCNRLSESACSKTQHLWPKLEDCMEVIALTMSQEYEYHDDDFPPGSTMSKALYTLGLYCANARLFIADGHLGMAQGPIEPADQICVLIGCEKPLVLQPTDDEKHLVVGECCVPHLSTGDALLGSLDEDVQAIFAQQPAGFVQFGFRNNKTGEVFYKDPRLESLGYDISGYQFECEGGNGQLIYVEPETIRSHGVDITYFDLV